MNEYIILTFFASLALSSLWLIAVLSAYVWGWIWAWVDDGKRPKRNSLLSLSMRAQGWSVSEPGNSWAYRKGDKTEGYDRREGSDGEAGFFYPLLALCFGPWVIAASILFYPVALAIATAFALAHVARFARRHKKLFDKHVGDPDAHKPK